MRLKALAGLLGLGLFAAITARLFVWPATDPPRRADAVLVFAGGRGERLREGTRLVQEGVAPVLVVSDGGVPGSRFARACRQQLGIRVVCVTPRESSTRAEARVFAELADREGWRSVAMVTSSYHVRRASLLLGRCYRGKVFTVAARPPRTGVDLAGRALREWAGLAAAFTLQRGC
jgi:uncharacterized SAM-binding protein YcdF (DUF218 family)